ncbi:MAG: 16S rRNA (cytidine(1402)-2'-O)-methyltransferase [Patescibacteria group bacterium]
MLGKFFITATPIGNLDDISIRMKETWVSVDVILCEDTRVTQTVLNHLKISKTVMSYHQHSDDLRIKEIAKLLQEGKSLALVTDAGTPGISDPGGRLIQELLKQFGDALNIIPIPGPSALTAALSICGFPADEFIFLGFPPHKKGRQTFFKRLDTLESTIVYYESTHRILKSLEELHDSIKDRPIVVCRELTKMYETIYRGTAADVKQQLETTSIKGEFVVVIHPKK